MTKILVKCNKCHKYGTVWVEKITDLKAIMQSKGWRIADNEAFCPRCEGKEI